MELPIDARLAPFRQKYLDSETPMFRRWFIFGENGMGGVDISDGTDDVIIGIPRDRAQKICDYRDLFVDRMVTLINGDENVGTL